ncbi:hypothetical protein ABT160_29155 [Streptomyces sp. NPDC001941]|uniref:hypothetical protein n=1 Tax=Streptomyces sp. NPDC001941 TaxID=3154659 RepID=UPI0033294A95
MFATSIDPHHVRGDMPVVRIDPAGALEDLATARVQLPGNSAMQAHAYGDSELVLTGVVGALEVGCPGRERVTLTPSACVMVPRGELFTLENRTDLPATALAVFSRGAVVDGLPRPRPTRARRRTGRALHAVA